MSSGTPRDRDCSLQNGKEAATSSSSSSSSSYSSGSSSSSYNNDDRKSNPVAVEMERHASNEEAVAHGRKRKGKHSRKSKKRRKSDSDRTPPRTSTVQSQFGSPLSTVPPTTATAASLNLNFQPPPQIAVAPQFMAAAQVQGPQHHLNMTAPGFIVVQPHMLSGLTAAPGVNPALLSLGYPGGATLFPYLNAAAANQQAAAQQVPSFLQLAPNLFSAAAAAAANPFLLSPQAAATFNLQASMFGAAAGAQPVNPMAINAAAAAAAAALLQGNVMATGLPVSSAAPPGGGVTGGAASMPMPPVLPGSTALRRDYPSLFIERTATGRVPISLYMECDAESLSPYQCVVRKQIELFEAMKHDVETNAQGRNRPIVLGQVGIRCLHCTMLQPKDRARGAVYYPARLAGLYQAAQNMAVSHLAVHCQHVPEDIREELRKLRERKSSAGGGKKYWGEGVRALGVFEDQDGLRFEPI